MLSKSPLAMLVLLIVAVSISLAVFGVIAVIQDSNAKIVRVDNRLSDAMACLSKAKRVVDCIEAVAKTVPNRGPRGPRGAVGATGGRGIAGLSRTGSRGPRGRPGRDAPLAIGEGTRVPGPPGPSGPAGESAVGPQGPPGETVIGPQGPQGPEGPPGDPAPPTELPPCDPTKGYVCTTPLPEPVVP